MVDLVRVEVTFRVLTVVGDVALHVNVESVLSRHQNMDETLNDNFI